jgi:hypothetical protein
MDNSLFAVNYVAVVPGLGVAYVYDNWTVQFEATLFQLTRVKGDLVDKDPARTNFTTGTAVGYAITPQWFAIGELRYQRWIDNNTVYHAANPAFQNLSFAVGPRYVFKAGEVTLRPGIAYAQGLVGPIASSGYTYPTNSDKIIFVDIPVAL